MFKGTRILPDTFRHSQKSDIGQAAR